MRTHLKQYQAMSILIGCALAASAWIEVAQAAAVRAPNRTVASEFIVAKPGEPDEVRAKRSRRHGKEIRPAGTAVRKDNAAATSPAPGTPPPINATAIAQSQ